MMKTFLSSRAILGNAIRLLIDLFIVVVALNDFVLEISNITVSNKHLSRGKFTNREGRNAPYSGSSIYATAK